MNGLIINLPYVSGFVPEALSKRLPLSGEQFRGEHWGLIDPHLAAVVKAAASYERRSKKIDRPVVSFPFSPLVADPWGLWAEELRPPDEPPAPFHPGPAIITQSTGGQPISWNAKDRELIFSRTVEPFYRAMEKEAEALLEKSALVLVLTIRSFSSRPFKFEKNQKFPRPQVSISSSSDLTPEGLAALAGKCFKAFGWWPELNWPHERAASLPPGLIGRPRFLALGLSLCRSLYMDEQSGRLKDSFQNVVRVLQNVFNLIDQELARVARLRIERAGRSKKESVVIKAVDLKKQLP